MRKWLYIFVSGLVLLYSCGNHEKEVRSLVSLNADWETILTDSLALSDEVFAANGFADVETKSVSIPHNWDQYYGYRRGKHGNLHGTAWYSKTFEVAEIENKKRYFLFFEGVGSYATVWVNGKQVGEHKGGRTSFTIDITDAIKSTNKIVVKADHPAFIADLPWVCGGCSGEWGFSEGSQPLGIFRPVSLLVTNNVKVTPYGMHAWLTNAYDENKTEAHLKIATEVKNYANEVTLQVVNRLIDKEGNTVSSVTSDFELAKTAQKEIVQELPKLVNPRLWSPDDPYLYTIVTEIKKEGELIDKTSTPYGIRWVSWPLTRNDGDNRLLINGKPYFINGTCEYEHMLGNSHSFSDTQIVSRLQQMQSAGFNAFREAHQPHNLKYQEFLDEEGMLFWSQFSAHIWYDTPEFKENFKNLIKEWIIERRNSPSVIMWGLQNESTIPEDFAEECTKLIRELDPTASKDRLVTTCNGGEGTDWNVIQNWSGTYGGNPYNYGSELKKDLLNGEYGAWRTAGMHNEGPFQQKGAYSEERFAQLMEIKLDEAEKVKDSVVGHYHWLFSSHENPGRIQNGEAYRDMDRVGPVNYKGLFTAWGEPTDAYYMYAGNYADSEKNPMVYIVSHSWPNRWLTPGIKDSIVVYSNCDEVELFNDIDGVSLGKKKHPGIGKHFQWDGVPVSYNILKAKGYINGKEVVTDIVRLYNLPEAPGFTKHKTVANDLLKPTSEVNYLYRINAGGNSFIDSFGNTWEADRVKTETNAIGSTSWGTHFEGVPDRYASQRSISDPIKGTANWQLFQTFRYGMSQLQFEYPVKDGDYTVELFFTEPWYGVGSKTSCVGYRVFDVAINDSIVEKNLDIWKESGFASALKKSYKVKASQGKIKISFPNVLSGQAVLSGIAIAGAKQQINYPESDHITRVQLSDNESYELGSWLDVGSPQYNTDAVFWWKLPYDVYGAEYLKLPKALFPKTFSGSFSVNKDVTCYVLLEEGNTTGSVEWLTGFEVSEEQAINSKGMVYNTYKRSLKKGDVFNFGHLKNGKSFGIAIVPEYAMGEEEEERPILTLQAEEATLAGDFTKANFKKSDYIAFEGARKHAVEWEVQTGLAGVHLIRFRFMNITEKPIDVQFQIEAPNGALMRDDIISFPVKPEKWKILNTTTGGYINAGTYKVRIIGDNLDGLWLDSFEFQ